MLNISILLELLNLLSVTTIFSFPNIPSHGQKDFGQSFRPLEPETAVRIRPGIPYRVIFSKTQYPSMKKVRITVMRVASYPDLMEKYENPIEHACSMTEGMVFVANGWQRPEGFCDSAWDTVSPFVMTLAHGGENFYNGWMKNKKSAMISCNDGFRPVSFLLEALDEDAE